MYVCLDCRTIFEEADCWEERHGLDYGPFEQCSGCPECGGDYTETFECDSCGEWITGDYIKTESGYRFCENCYTHMEIGDED